MGAPHSAADAAAAVRKAGRSPTPVRNAIDRQINVDVRLAIRLHTDRPREEML